MFCYTVSGAGPRVDDILISIFVLQNFLIQEGHFHGVPPLQFVHRVNKCSRRSRQNVKIPLGSCDIRSAWCWNLNSPCLFYMALEITLRCSTNSITDCHVICLNPLRHPCPFVFIHFVACVFHSMAVKTSCTEPVARCQTRAVSHPRLAGDNILNTCGPMRPTSCRPFVSF